MCGIFAYKGEKNVTPILLNGLKRLEYRGYDSWGIAVQTDNKIYVEKQIGKISEIENLNNFPTSHIGIAHTRWATTGAVTQINAHPHFSTDKSFTLAQNGIVENYLELKADLIKKGYQFLSQTDTEVIVRLIEDKLKQDKNLVLAVRNAFLELKGRNTIIILTNEGKIIAARNGSPLVIGLNDQTNELFISSDTLSFAPYANKMIVIDNGQLISLDQEIEIIDIKTGQKYPNNLEVINLHNNKVDKEGHPHFIHKEIFETPQTLIQLTKQNKNLCLELASAIKRARTVYTIGSGTAGAAASQIAYYLRKFAKINAIGLIGADAQEYIDLFSKEDLIIAPSQSGETADVLEVLEIAKQKKVKIASYVNMPGAMMTRLSDYKFMANAGPEISVVSTKIFTSQIAWGYLIAKAVNNQFDEALTNIQQLAQEIDKYLKTENNHLQIKSLAKQLVKNNDIFLLGKSQNYLIVKEGMVKLIECSYKHAQAMPSGDLKHYAITLMQPGIPVITVLSNDDVKADVINAINEVKARGAMVIGISPDNEQDFSVYLPVPDTRETSAIMNLIPLQLLAYYLGVEMGNDVDKPRNIAKSVTVK